MDDQGKGLFTVLTDYAKQPFSSNMGLGGWALFTGLILVLVVLWTRALRHIVP